MVFTRITNGLFLDRFGLGQSVFENAKGNGNHTAWVSGIAERRVMCKRSDPLDFSNTLTWTKQLGDRIRKIDILGRPCGAFGLKREAGENPARVRHRDEGRNPHQATGYRPGKARGVG